MLRFQNELHIKVCNKWSFRVRNFRVIKFVDIGALIGDKIKHIFMVYFKVSVKVVDDIFIFKKLCIRILFESIHDFQVLYFSQRHCFG